jgi:hypothetical protein
LIPNATVRRSTPAERLALARAAKRGGSTRVPDEPAKARLVRGTRAIGQLLGINPDQAWYLLTHKKLPGRKIGKFWTVPEHILLAYVSTSQAAPLDDDPARDTSAQTAPARRKRWDKRPLPAPTGTDAQPAGGGAGR